MQEQLSTAALFVVLHRLLAHIEKDVDAFAIRNTPSWIIRYHLFRPFDVLTDAAAIFLLPLFQPAILRSIPWETEALAAGMGQLDIFRPTTTPLPAPVLLFVHGGIWTLGNRRQYRALGQRLAAEGFVAVILGYLTWPAANASEQAGTVRSALAHAKSRASAWGGDPARVFLSGQSSGANVSALALLDVERARGGGGTHPGTPPAAPTRAAVHCAGFIGMAGPYDLVAHFEHESRRGVQDASMMAVACEPLDAHSPTRIVRQSGACLACDRVLLLHGEKDHTVPLSSSALFAVALARAGQTSVEIAPLSEVSHLDFLLDLMLGRPCGDLLGHLKRFCAVVPRVPPDAPLHEPRPPARL
jgi:prenylcysteine alpha-carboxyl methylesterase